jgi:hypothetical protein
MPETKGRFTMGRGQTRPPFGAGNSEGRHGLPVDGLCCVLVGMALGALVGFSQPQDLPADAAAAHAATSASALWSPVNCPPPNVAAHRDGPPSC